MFRIKKHRKRLLSVMLSLLISLSFFNLLPLSAVRAAEAAEHPASYPDRLFAGETTPGENPSDWQLQMDIAQDACYVFDLERNGVLFEKNAGEQRRGPLAVNIMLSLLALENLDSSIPLTVSREISDLSSEENILALRFDAGTRYKPDYLLYALLLYDSGAAAKMLGEALYEDTEKLVESMNKRARAIGLDKTDYFTRDGEKVEAYTSLSDLGRLMALAYSNKTFLDIFRTQSVTYVQDNTLPSILENRLHSAWTWSNDLIKGAVLAGDKSINTMAFQADGPDYSIIVLTASNRTPMIRNQDLINASIREVIDIIEAVFDYYEKSVLVRRGEHCKDIVQQDGITISLNYLDTAYYLRPQAAADYTPTLQLSVSDTITLPVIAGQRLGQMTFIMPDSTRYVVNVGSAKDIFSQNSTLDSMLSAIRDYPEVLRLASVLLVLLILIALIKTINYFVRRLILYRQERRSR